ncbi:DUF6478 family protein [Jannaschia donghaensis]|uniref:Uncharacterized protein n=1 Tax=Jannaschia donghaensis TaxID=420998 RepID=A0A0M6YHP9_9RHOB|nr:DUF6478 family protein [Jannaschia donghaensis]CTQ49309.1 hypothetical protein JDO7802_01322 [Jannaschia donghaensis]
MAVPRLPSLVESLRSRLAVRRWQRAAQSAETLDAATLARLGPRARQVATHARQLAEAADRVLDGRHVGTDAIDRPPQCDWAWRPAPWAVQMTPQVIAGATGGTGLTDGVRLFHDCPLTEITLKQTRTNRPDAAAPYALSVDALGFAGSFLSLALDLPQQAALSLRRSHIIGISTRLKMERTGEMFVRLNIKQGPNTDQMVSELRPGDHAGSPVTAEFDLGFDEINPAKLEGAWIDLIFERPEMNLVRIEDLTVTRRPRADI